jgi:hypothetical protein
VSSYCGSFTFFLYSYSYFFILNSHLKSPRSVHAWSAFRSDPLDEHPAAGYPGNDVTTVRPCRGPDRKSCGQMYGAGRRQPQRKKKTQGRFLTAAALPESSESDPGG